MTSFLPKTLGIFFLLAGALSANIESQVGELLMRCESLIVEGKQVAHGVALFFKEDELKKIEPYLEGKKVSWHEWARHAKLKEQKFCGFVIEVSGEVTLERGLMEFEITSLKEGLIKNDVITTGEDSSVKVLFGENLITIPPKTTQRLTL